MVLNLGMKNPEFLLYKRETTKFWTESIRDRAGKIYDVYIFDPDRHVNCCEIPSSYEMNYVGPTWTNTLENDEDNQDLYEEVMDGSLGTEQTLYVHVLGFKLDKSRIINIDDQIWESLLIEHENDYESVYRIVLEKCIEYCQCNGIVC